jgi:hypothetical protein
MDPYQGLVRWERWRVGGSAAVLSNVIDHLNANLPAGWKRIDRPGGPPSLLSPDERAGRYAIDSASGQVVFKLSIERLGDSSLRGGRVFFTRSRPSASDLEESWSQVIRLLEEGIIPSARATGATIHAPTIEEIFFEDLPFEVRDRLEAFSNSSRKCLPLDYRETELWNEFVVTAFRSQTAIEDEPFANWFVAHGWPREPAETLKARFFDECRLLSTYREEVIVR